MRAGQLLGQSESRICRRLSATVEAAHARLNSNNVVCVSAYDLNRSKGQKRLPMFADPMTQRVLFVLPGEGAPVWEQFAADSPQGNGHPKAGQNVAIDKSAAYT